jgi:hypothetical protein
MQYNVHTRTLQITPRQRIRVPMLSRLLGVRWYRGHPELVALVPADWDGLELADTDEGRLVSYVVHLATDADMVDFGTEIAGANSPLLQYLGALDQPGCGSLHVFAHGG